mmetsp:Transcript_17359/g.16698  ORF Transcript_17359/g.16698 Transcript_17359/m.16698 type:complete len:240 (+) Transcript_17359:484-1203(+)
MSILISLLLFCLLALSTVDCINDSIVTREDVIELQHLISDHFSIRSKYIIKHKSDGSQEINVLESENNGIVSSEVTQFQNSLVSNSLYRIQLVTRSPDGGVKSAVSAAVPVCDLQKSGFKEDLVLHLDNSNNIMGVSYSSPVMAISQVCDSTKFTAPVTFQTRMKISEVEVAQAVPLQAVGPKPITMNGVNFGAETDPSAKPQQSLLRQYWYIFLPLMIVLFMGGGGDDGAGPATKAKK